MSQVADVQFFSKREKPYPKKVKGTFRKLKSTIATVLLFVYFFAPYLRWDRGSGLPDQAILIDMPARRAYVFFVEIWPQEVYLLTGLLIIFAVGLFFITTLLGRFWCGYLCFHTVWSDWYVGIERFFQGDYLKRKKLDASPWNWNKVWRKGVTNLIYIVIALVTGFSFVAYFNDAPTLFKNLWHADLSPAVFTIMMGVALIAYFMPAYAREQICHYVCPYARFQSAMFDQDTLIVGYDTNRGEPRGKHKKDEPWEGRGHCIDCKQCVQVCPVGIDIRNGLQMECVACALCVDACNGVMEKVGLPKSLIRYDTTRNQELRQKGQKEKIRIFRPRVFYYFGILATVAVLMMFAVYHRSLFELHVMHDRNPLFVQLSSGKIRNGYEMNVLNKTQKEKTYRFSFEGLEDADVILKKAGQEVGDVFQVGADQTQRLRIFVIASPVENAQQPIKFILEDVETGEKEEYKSLFISQ